MSCVEEVNLRIRQIPPVSVSACRQECGIMTTPNGQERREVLAKVSLESRIQRNVVAVVEDQIKLDVLRAWARHVGDVKFVAIGRQVLLIRSGAILPVADRVRCERRSAGFPVARGWVAPIGFPWPPFVTETLDVGVAVL